MKAIRFSPRLRSTVHVKTKSHGMTFCSCVSNISTGTKCPPDALIQGDDTESESVINKEGKCNGRCLTLALFQTA